MAKADSQSEDMETLTIHCYGQAQSLARPCRILRLSLDSDGFWTDFISCLFLGTVARPWDSRCEATSPTTGSSCHLLKDNVLQKAMLCLIYGRGQGSAM